MTQTKLGIIGLGSIGSRHAENAVATGCDVRWHDPHREGSMSRDEIIPWADKIIIATPTHLHMQDIIECVTFKKPMMVEKPLAKAWSGCLYNENVRMVGYNLRFHSLVQQIRESISSGKLGEPVWANFTLGQLTNKPDYMRDGVIFNWSHEIDLALHLLGPAKHISHNVKRAENGQDIMADILLTHQSGCLTTIHLDYVSNPWIRTGSIVGSKSDIYYDLEGGIADICGEIVRCPADEFDESYKRELKAFLDDNIGPGCTAKQAADVMSICMEARL